VAAMTNIYNSLERLFHEPSRFSMRLRFRSKGEADLFSVKIQCGLTDGNLSGHLLALEKAGAILMQRALPTESQKRL